MAKAELSVLLQGLRGKAGNVVFNHSKDGTHVKPHVKGSNPNTPAQQLVRANLRKAAGIFKGFTPVQLAAWTNYAETQTFRDKNDGSAYKPSPINAFMKFACKFLQVTPNGTVPTTPPTTSYYGDNVGITVTGGTGKLTFTASAANSTNTTTEILLQPLASANRKPQKNAYRTKQLNQFTAGNLSIDVTVPAGYYAAGYRFVNTQTGQDTEMYPLNISTVSFEVALGGKSENKKAA